MYLSGLYNVYWNAFREDPAVTPFHSGQVRAGNEDLCRINQSIVVFFYKDIRITISYIQLFQHFYRKFVSGSFENLSVIKNYCTIRSTKKI